MVLIKGDIVLALSQAEYATLRRGLAAEEGMCETLISECLGHGWGRIDNPMYEKYEALRLEAMNLGCILDSLTILAQDKPI